MNLIYVSSIVLDGNSKIEEDTHKIQSEQNDAIKLFQGRSRYFWKKSLCWWQNARTNESGATAKWEQKSEQVREWAEKLMLAKINKFNEVNISYETFGEFQRGAQHTPIMYHTKRAKSRKCSVPHSESKWEILRASANKQRNGEKRKRNYDTKECTTG